MFLLHTASFGALRQELIETLGTEGARELLTRIGYLSGARDANIIRRKWPEGDLASAFTAGPRLHSLEGIVKVTPVQFSFDIDRGSFYGEFLWTIRQRPASTSRRMAFRQHPPVGCRSATLAAMQAPLWESSSYTEKLSVPRWAILTAGTRGVRLTNGTAMLRMI